MLSQATATTLGLAAAAALLTTAAALPVAWLAVRYPGRLSALVERSTYIANALPGIVVALALVTVSIELVPALYQTVPLLLAGYAILFLPRAVVSVRSTLEQAPPVLEDVARSLGCTGLQAARRVTLPLVLPGLGAGHGAGLPGGQHRADRHPAAGADRQTTLATEFWSAPRRSRTAPRRRTPCC